MATDDQILREVRDLNEAMARVLRLLREIRDDVQRIKRDM